MNKHWPNRKSKYNRKQRKPLKAFEFWRSPNVIKQKGEKAMQIFITLLRESVLIQGFITASFVLTTCYLWLTGQQVPTELWYADTLVLGFFFGSKSQRYVINTTQKKGG